MYMETCNLLNLSFASLTIEPGMFFAITTVVAEIVTSPCLVEPGALNPPQLLVISMIQPRFSSMIIIPVRFYVNFKPPASVAAGHISTSIPHASTSKVPNRRPRTRATVARRVLRAAFGGSATPRQELPGRPCASWGSSLTGDVIIKT